MGETMMIENLKVRIDNFIKNFKKSSCDMRGYHQHVYTKGLLTRCIACEKLINIDRYRDYCLKNDLLTASVLYFKTSAETSFQYLTAQHNFVEDHTALSDATIEAQILTKALKKGKVEPQLSAFPFRNLGKTTDYVQKKPKYKQKVIDALAEYIDANDGFEKRTGYWTSICRTYRLLTGEGV